LNAGIGPKPVVKNPLDVNHLIAETQGIRFEENKGQILQLWDRKKADYVKFSVQGLGSKVFLLSNGWAQQFEEVILKDVNKNDGEFELKTHRVNYILEGANAQAEIIKEGESMEYVNFYSHDVMDVHTFKKVIYKNVYPNIDWVVYSNEKGMKYDFVVHPGGNPEQIKIKITDFNGSELTPEGTLKLQTSLGEITEDKPFTYQVAQQEVNSAYLWDGQYLSFALGKYDASQDLVIDPVRLWTTLYGGTSTDLRYSTNTYIMGSAVDSDNNIIAVGNTYAINGIATSGAHRTYHSGADRIGFVVKFNSGGSRLWATYYGNSASGKFTEFNGVAVDTSKNIYVVGRTNCDTAMATNSTAQTSRGGSDDALLVKFSSSGIRSWATYKGGSENEVGYGVAVDKINSLVYIVGGTKSTSGITLFGCGTQRCSKSSTGDWDGFITKINMSNGTHASGGANSYFGKDGSFEVLNDVVVDPSGNIYVTGYTNASSSSSGELYYSITNSTVSHQTTPGGVADAVVAKYSISLDFLWATFYGGDNDDRGVSIALDQYNNVYVSGNTSSQNAIATSGVYKAWTDSDDGFIVKFNTNGSRQWGSYFGGDDFDRIRDIAYSSSLGLVTTGITSSIDSIVTKDAYQEKMRFIANQDCFIHHINPSNGSLIYGTYFGSENTDYSQTVSVDGNGNVIIAGYTYDTSNLASNNAHLQNGTRSYNTSYGEYYYNGFIAKFGNATVDWRQMGTWSTTSNWSTGVVPNATDIVRILGGAVTYDGTIPVNELYIHNNSLLQLGADMTIHNLYIKRGGVDLNNYKLTITGNIYSSSDSGDYFIRAGTLVNPKPYSKLWFLPKTNGVTSGDIYFLPAANTIHQLVLGHDTGKRNGIYVRIKNEVKIKGGRDGSGHVGPGFVEINKNSFLEIPEIKLLSDTMNAFFKFTGDDYTKYTQFWMRSSYINIEHEYYGARGWRIMGNPKKVDTTLQDLTDDIEVIGKGGTSRGFYSNTDTMASAYYMDYSKADSTSSTDPGWVPFTSAIGTVIGSSHNQWKARQPIIYFNPGAVRGTGAFSNPSNATYQNGVIDFDLHSYNLMDGLKKSFTVNPANYPGGALYIVNNYSAPLKISSLGLTSTNVHPYFYYWKQRRNAITNNFMPAQWQAELITTGNTTRDENISIPPYGAILVKLKSSSSWTLNILESGKQTSNFGYIVGGANGISSQNLMFTEIANPVLGPGAVELKLLVDDSLEVDRMVVYNRDSQSLNFGGMDAKKYRDILFPNIFAITADGKSVELDAVNIDELMASGLNEVEVPLVITKDKDNKFQNLSLMMGEKNTEVQTFIKNSKTQEFISVSSLDVIKLKISKDEMQSSDYSLVFKRKSNSLNDVESKSSESLLVYPNPSSQQITVRTTGKGINQTYKVIDALGKLVVSGSMNGSVQLNVSTWTEGIYFISVNGEVKKFIKTNN
jgi:hypothetical protein